MCSTFEALFSLLSGDIWSCCAVDCFTAAAAAAAAAATAATVVAAACDCCGFFLWERKQKSNLEIIDLKWTNNVACLKRKAPVTTTNSSKADEERKLQNDVQNCSLYLPFVGLFATTGHRCRRRIIL